jgi:hypothetical protein
MADPNQLSRQERHLVHQLHSAKLATKQRLSRKRAGRQRVIPLTTRRWSAHWPLGRPVAGSSGAISAQA